MIYKCPHCKADIIVDVEPLVPAKLFGPPELCHPEEGGTIDPTECEECGAEFDLDDIIEKFNDLKTEREIEDREEP